MSQNSPSQIVNAPVHNLNQLIKSKKDIYNMLSKQYCLPKFHSKAINRIYLDQYSYDPIPIFTIPRDKVKISFVLFRRKTSEELWEELEKFLKNKSQKPTGMTLTTLPDLQWLQDVIFTIDPTNECGLFQPQVSIQNTFHRSINPVYD